MFLFREFYNITNELPEHCLLTRCKVGKKKNIYITSPEVREIVMNNAEKIKIINTGVKVFARCDTKGMKCAFRLAQEVVSREYVSSTAVNCNHHNKQIINSTSGLTKHIPIHWPKKKGFYH